MSETVNPAILIALWALVLVAMIATVRFIYTALSAPEKAGDDDRYHRDFRRLKIPYYFVVWAGLGSLVFFGIRAFLDLILSSLSLESLAGMDPLRDALAAGFAFVSILLIHQLSVMREHVGARNRQWLQAEAFREHVLKLVEELDFMEGAQPHEIRAFFYNCRADIEAAGPPLTEADRELLRDVLALARRGIPEMDGIEPLL